MTDTTTTCTPVVDRIYGRGDRTVALCPDCGKVVEVEGRNGDATVVPAHTAR